MLLPQTHLNVFDPLQEGKAFMAEVVMNIDEDAALIVAAPPGASLLLFVSQYPAEDSRSPSLLLRIILHHQRSPTRPP